jgi:IQ calmodulin-binding motif
MMSINEQSIARRFLSYQHTAKMRHNRMIQSTVSIQTYWRRYHAMQNYSNDLAALTNELAAITIGSYWRRYNAMKIYRNILAERLAECLAATTIESAWRRYQARSAFKEHLAAVTIASAWRRYQARAEYVEMIAVHRAVVKIQSGLRRYRAQSEYIGMLQVREAAVKIQSAWRRFWDFSHYIILLYEIVKVQSRVRSKIAVENYNLQLGCCILLQSVLRGYLAKKHYSRLHQAWTSSLSAEDRQIIANNKIQRWRRTVIENDKKFSIIFSPMFAQEMKERVAARKIQRFWKPFDTCRREKKAALVIERFFLLIKAEIELEIVRREKRRSTKNKSRRDKRRSTEDHSLDLVGSSYSQDTYSLSPVKKRFGSNFNNSADERQVQLKAIQAQHNDDRRLVTHRASSPSMNLVMRHENDKDAETVSPSGTFQVNEDASIVSGLTFLTSTSPRHLKQQGKIHHIKLEEQVQTMRPRVSHSGTSHSRAESMQTESAADKYMKMYGIKPGASRSTGRGHFFSDDVESVTSSVRPNTPTRTGTFSQKAMKSVNNRQQPGATRTLTLDTLPSPAETSNVRRLSRRFSGSHAGSSSSSAFHHTIQDTWPTNRDVNDHSEYYNHHDGYAKVTPLRLHAIGGRPTTQYPYNGGPAMSQTSMQYSSSGVSDYVPSEGSWSMGSVRSNSLRQLYQPGYSNQMLDVQRSRSVLSGVQHSMKMSHDQRPRSTGKIRSSSEQVDERRMSRQEEVEKQSRNEKYSTRRGSSSRSSSIVSPSNVPSEKSSSVIMESHRSSSKSTSRGRTSQSEKHVEKTTPSSSSSNRRRTYDRNSYGVI